MAKPGRKSSYTDAIGAAICAKVAEGSNLTRICNEAEMPSRETVYSWLREYPAFADAYARAREDRGDWRNDRLDQLQQQLEDVQNEVRAGLGGKEANAIVSAIRAQIDTLKWQAAHESPKRYGDRVELAGDANAPLLPPCINVRFVEKGGE